MAQTTTAGSGLHSGNPALSEKFIETERLMAASETSARGSAPRSCRITTEPSILVKALSCLMPDKARNFESGALPEAIVWAGERTTT